jgi:hypothetical protein
VAERLSCVGIPTLIFVHDGKEVYRKQGLSKEDGALEQQVKKFVNDVVHPSAHGPSGYGA